MRLMAVCGIASAVVVAGCDLGVVDLVLPPSPAELVVVSEIRADPTTPDQVEVSVRAALDPGIGPDGKPRALDSGTLLVEGAPYLPSMTGQPPSPTWDASISFPAPGPEGVRLTLPRPEGFGPGTSLTMRVRVMTTPEGTILLDQGEDLVITTELPSSPAETVEWSLALSSATMPGFRLQLGGTGPWPEQIRVPSEQLPTGAFPITAEARIEWDRGFTLIELTPQERYDLVLRSIMRLAWTLEVAP